MGPTLTQLPLRDGASLPTHALLFNGMRSPYASRPGFQTWSALDDPRVQREHGNYVSFYLLAYDRPTQATMEILKAEPIPAVHGASWVTWIPAR